MGVRTDLEKVMTPWRVTAELQQKRIAELKRELEKATWRLNCTIDSSTEHEMEPVETNPLKVPYTVDGWKACAEELRSQLTQVEAERDDARREIENWKVLADQHETTIDRLRNKLLGGE